MSRHVQSLHFCSHQLRDWQVEHAPHFSEDEDCSLLPFRIHRKIAKGAFGAVYEVSLCCHPEFRMAAKRVNHNTDTNIAREVMVSRSLCHSSVVMFYDVVSIQNYYVLLMEYFPGPELYIWVTDQTSFYHRTKIPWEGFCERLCILQKVLQIMIYFQKSHIAHRDWKLENLLYDAKSKTLKVCDFNLADYVEHPTQTVCHEKCGSPHYVSPELMTGAYSMESSTVWSFGVLVYSLLFGEFPFKNNEARQSRRPRKQILQRTFVVPPQFQRLAQLLLRDLFTQVFAPVRLQTSLADLQTHPFWGLAITSKPLPRTFSCPAISTSKKTKLVRSQSVSSLQYEINENEKPENENKELPTALPLAKIPLRLLLSKRNLRFAQCPGCPEWKLARNFMRNMTKVRAMFSKMFHMSFSCRDCEREDGMTDDCIIT